MKRVRGNVELNGTVVVQDVEFMLQESGGSGQNDSWTAITYVVLDQAFALDASAESASKSYTIVLKDGRSSACTAVARPRRPGENRQAIDLKGSQTLRVPAA